MLLFGSNFDLVSFLVFLFVAVFAFAYHEFAHAIVADRLGDSTPRSYGRITLNPIVHLDILGLIMLVLIGFGWATTPVNPNNLRGNRRVSHAIVAAAGPAANLMMAIAFAIPLRLLGLGLLPAAWAPDWLLLLFRMGVFLNLFLIFFNLLPIPPLDGFTVLLGVLPADLAYQMASFRQYGTLVFFLVIFILPRISPLLSVFAVIMPMVNNIFTILTGRFFFL